MQISHLFAGKPRPFGRSGAPSSIIKQAKHSLNIKYDGAVEDEQGNKKLHGGPYMAIHQYAQDAYSLLSKRFSNVTPSPITPIEIGSIGENISAPDMHEENVFIGDQYKIGSAVLQVVSPRAPCAKINYRYGINKMDMFVAQNSITGWYYSVLQEGLISLNDSITLLARESNPISVKQVWQLRQMIKTLPEADTRQAWLALADNAVNTQALAPEWQAYANRAAVKLMKGS